MEMTFGQPTAGCGVCGSRTIRTDEARPPGSAAAWLLAECTRCAHRWTAQRTVQAARRVRRGAFVALRPQAQRASAGSGASAPQRAGGTASSAAGASTGRPASAA